MINWERNRNPRSGSELKKVRGITFRVGGEGRSKREEEGEEERQEGGG